MVLATAILRQLDHVAGIGVIDCGRRYSPSPDAHMCRSGLSRCPHLTATLPPEFTLRSLQGDDAEALARLHLVA